MCIHVLFFHVVFILFFHRIKGGASCVHHWAVGPSVLGGHWPGGGIEARSVSLHFLSGGGLFPSSRQVNDPYPHTLTLRCNNSRVTPVFDRIDTTGLSV